MHPWCVMCRPFFKHCIAPSSPVGINSWSIYLVDSPALTAYACVAQLIRDFAIGVQKADDGKPQAAA